MDENISFNCSTEIGWYCLSLSTVLVILQIPTVVSIHLFISHSTFRCLQLTSIHAQREIVSVLQHISKRRQRGSTTCTTSFSQRCPRKGQREREGNIPLILNYRLQFGRSLVHHKDFTHGKTDGAVKRRWT